MTAFERLINEHKDAVYRQMIRACGNREDAEDVLIEALLNAYRSIGQLRDESAFRSWVTQIGKRICWHLKNREALRPILQLSALEEEGRDVSSGDMPTDERIAAQQMIEKVHAAVEALPPGYRDVYELRDIQELSGEETARRLGLSLAAQKSRLHRARALVRENLDAALVPRLPA